MTRRISGLLSAALLVAVLACKDDPTSSLRGGVASFSANPNPAFVNAGDTTAITVFARDAQLNPLEADFSATIGNGATASLVLDNSAPDPSGRTRKYNVIGLAPGQTFVNLSSGSVTGKDTINVMPVAFNGTVSSGTPQGGDQITINGTSALGFSPGSAVTFGAGGTGRVNVSTASQLQVVVPFGATGNPTISGVTLSFLPGFSATLPATFTVNQSGNRWAASNAWATAPDISSLLPASGGTVYMIMKQTSPNNAAVCPEYVLFSGFGATGPCMIFRFTVAATTTLNFQVDWIGTASNPDIDIYACADSVVANFGADCYEDGGAGATGSKPQATGNFAYPAGTHWLVVENFGGTESANHYVRITRP